MEAYFHFIRNNQNLFRNKVRHLFGDVSEKVHFLVPAVVFDVTEAGDEKRRNLHEKLMHEKPPQFELSCVQTLKMRLFFPHTFSNHVNVSLFCISVPTDCCILQIAFARGW